MKPPHDKRPGGPRSDRPRGGGGPDRPRDPAGKPGRGPGGSKPAGQRFDERRGPPGAWDKRGPRQDTGGGARPSHSLRDEPRPPRPGQGGEPARQPRLTAPQGTRERGSAQGAHEPATHGWQRREEGDRPRAQDRGLGERSRAPRDQERPRASRDTDRPRAPRDAGPRAPRDAGPPRLPGAPPGTVWLYGIHAIAAALANPARRLRRLLLTEEAEAALAGKLPQPWSLAPERTERSRIDHLLGHDVVHQGAALLADPLTTPSMERLLENPGPVLVLDQVNDPRNIGAILRSAAAFGAAGVITQDRNAPEETGALAKAASGALEAVPLLRAVNLARTLVALKAAGCWVIGLDAGGQALSGKALAQRRVVLVLGAEGSGLRRLTRDTCDELAGLGMSGAMESLNVSAAAAIALYELNRVSDTQS